MQWSEINRAPSSRSLRQFAGLCLLVFGGMACWQLFRAGNETAALVFAVLALGLGPLGLVRPQALRWVYVGWMIAAFPIGWLVARLVLAVLYFGVFTPIGLVFRATGRDALQRRPRAERESYWTPKAPVADPRSYLYQS